MKKICVRIENGSFIIKLYKICNVTQEKIYSLSEFSKMMQENPEQFFDGTYSPFNGYVASIQNSEGVYEFMFYDLYEQGLQHKIWNWVMEEKHEVDEDYEITIHIISKK